MVLKFEEQVLQNEQVQKPMAFVVFGGYGDQVLRPILRLIIEEYLVSYKFDKQTIFDLYC